MKQTTLRIGMAIMCISMMWLSACSPQKNTAMSRRVQALKANYNTYYNGHQAFIEGYKQQREGNRDNYLEIIPYYMTGNKATQSVGKSLYDRAIEKSQKTIKLHSITKKPDVSASRRRTPKGKLWLAQKEYNPFLYKAWFLMGDAQFQKGEYLEAAATYAYIQRLYSTKPNIVAHARLSEARCYAEMEWFYDAEDLLQRTQRDSIPDRLQAAKAAVMADLNVRQKRYAEAIPNLKKAIKQQRGTLEKARLYYLLGQLYHETGQDQLAYKTFKKVYRLNPPYELEFNARIQQSEVLSKGQSKQMIAKLRRMAKQPKNKNYLDQVYYAIGNIHLAKGDTLSAIYAYKDGVEKSVQNGIPKGVVWHHLGRLYWEREEFVKAQACYAGVLGLLDKERPDYKEIDERSKILDDLLPHASAIELQDSLQALARMDSLERMDTIRRLIEEVKKKEKAEQRKEIDSKNSQQQQNQRYTGQANNRQGNTQGQTAGVWYFYNPTAVAAGKADFQKKWGTRQLTDDWRRSNKTVLGTTDEDSDNSDETTPADSTDNTNTIDKPQGKAEQKALEKQQEYENNPHRPEYYLKDIPFTEEQMQASNNILVEALYNAAIIYKDRMENFPLAERTFQRICIDFPWFDHMDETYYNLFQLYSRIGWQGEADIYRNKLISEFPDNEHVALISDPMFEYKGRYGRQIEDSLYQEAYNAYINEDFHTVIRHAEYTEHEYPEGNNRARFMFLNAMSQLNLGRRDQFLNSMRSIVEQYPKSTVSELAGLYVKGLREGRLLQGGKMDNGSIWDRRIGVLDGDSLLNDTTFSDERLTNWTFVIAYERDSIDENQLLYEVAHYNFSNFSVRNFDLEIVNGDGIDMLQVRSFMNYDEAYIYFHKLINNADMAYKLEGLKLFIISENNLKKLMKGLSFADYFEFYDDVFDRVGKLKVDDFMLDEPTEIPDPEDIIDEPLDDEDDWDDEDNYIF